MMGMPPEDVEPPLSAVMNEKYRSFFPVAAAKLVAGWLLSATATTSHSNSNL